MLTGTPMPTKKRTSKAKSPEDVPKKTGKIQQIDEGTRHRISKTIDALLDQLDEDEPSFTSLAMSMGPDGKVFVSTDGEKSWHVDHSNANTDVFKTPPKPCAGCKVDGCVLDELGADLLTSATCHRAIHGHRLENRKIRYYLGQDH